MNNFYYDWTPERKAKFVEYRFHGMHTEWAMFWALVDRVAYRRETGMHAYSQEQVDKYIVERFDSVWEYWTKPMSGTDAKDLYVPQGLRDQLTEGVE